MHWEYNSTTDLQACERVFKMELDALDRIPTHSRKIMRGLSDELAAIRAELARRETELDRRRQLALTNAK